MKIMNLSDKEWKKRLSEEQYKVLREKGTEPPFTGEYCDCKKEGMYHCAACGAPLFDSDHKFDSGSGWPSFDRPIEEEAIETEEDHSLALERTEVLCKNCHSHLGHLFPDGPTETHQRYCINSIALKLEEKK